MIKRIAASAVLFGLLIGCNDPTPAPQPLVTADPTMVPFVNRVALGGHIARLSGTLNAVVTSGNGILMLCDPINTQNCITVAPVAAGSSPSPTPSPATPIVTLAPTASPTAAPTASPTPMPTPTPTPVPTATPTPVPTATPTPSPTATPTPTPTPTLPPTPTPTPVPPVVLSGGSSNVMVGKVDTFNIAQGNYTTGFSATSSNSKVAAVGVYNHTLYITGVAAGNATITVV